MHRPNGQISSKVVSGPVSPLNLICCSPKGDVPPRFGSKPAAVQPSAGRFASAWAAIQAAQPSPAADKQHRSDNVSVDKHSGQQGCSASEFDDGASSAVNTDSCNSSQPSIGQPRHPSRTHRLLVSLPVRIGRSSSDEASSALEQQAAHEPHTPRQRQQHQCQHGTEHLSAPADKGQGQSRSLHLASPRKHKKQHRQNSASINPADEPWQCSFRDMQRPMRSSRDMPRRTRSEHRAARHLRMSPQAASTSPQSRHQTKHAKHLARASSDSLSEHSIRQNPIYSPEATTAMLMPAEQATPRGAPAQRRRFLPNQKRAMSQDGARGRRERGPARVPQVAGKGPGMRENAVFGSPWSSFGSEGELEGLKSQALHMPRCSGRWVRACCWGVDTPVGCTMPACHIHKQYMDHLKKASNMSGEAQQEKALLTIGVADSDSTKSNAYGRSSIQSSSAVSLM